MNDIVERLEAQKFNAPFDLVLDAAKEITRLRAIIGRSEETPPALEIVKKLREVAQIGTGLLYSRRSMLIDAATTIEGLTPTAFEYRIEYQFKPQKRNGDAGSGGWGKGPWKIYTAVQETNEEDAKEYFTNFRAGFDHSVHDFFRLTRRPLNEWEPVE